MLLHTTAAHFEEVLAESREKLVLLDFYAPWCAPCRALAPQLDALSDSYEETLSAYSVNVDTDGAIAEQFGVTQLPTVVLLHGEKKHILSQNVTAEAVEQCIADICG